MPYGSDAGFEAWLDANGYVLHDNPDLTVLRTRGSVFVDSYERLFTGTRTGGVMQEMAWPRTGAFSGCIHAIPDDAIPPAVVNASYRAAYLEHATPGVLEGPVQTGPRVRRQKVDVIEREFFDDGKVHAGSATGFIDPMIDSMLAAFICIDGGGFFFASLGS